MPNLFEAFAAHAVWITALIGACIGSFLSFITYRFIHEQPMLTARSACASCGKTLGARDLIPVFSWLLLRARARCCGTKISARYPLIELACAASAAWLVHRFGATPLAACYVFMAWCILGLALADLEAYLLPDILLLPLALAGMAHGIVQGYALTDMALACAAAGGFAYALRAGGTVLCARPALGLGDVKLIAVSGIWFASLIALVPYLFFSGCLGIALAILWRIAGRGEVFPFGPALLLSLALCVIFPQSMDVFWHIYH